MRPFSIASPTPAGSPHLLPPPPLTVSPHRFFVGQGGARGKKGEGGGGMKQAEQKAVLAEFRAGSFNTLVATCIGEEGLDIPEVRFGLCECCSILVASGKRGWTFQRCVCDWKGHLGYESTKVLWMSQHAGGNLHRGSGAGHPRGAFVMVMWMLQHSDDG